MDPTDAGAARRRPRLIGQPLGRRSRDAEETRAARHAAGVAPKHRALTLRIGAAEAQGARSPVSTSAVSHRAGRGQLPGQVHSGGSPVRGGVPLGDGQEVHATVACRLP